MNLRKQVEPLKKAALQASSLQRRAHHAASRLTWVKRWLKRAYRHHAQSRELKLWRDLTPTRRYLSRQPKRGLTPFPHRAQEELRDQRWQPREVVAKRS